MATTHDSNPSESFNLADLLAVVCDEIPDRLALIYGSRHIRFNELNERVKRLASALHSLGLRSGDRVGLQLYNSPEYLESFLACCCIGALPVNINYRYLPNELAPLYASLALNALIHEASLADNVAAAVHDLPSLQWRIVHEDQAAPNATLRYEILLASGSSTFRDTDRSGNDQILLCTGGTTGRPKGVIWPHKSLFYGALGGGGIFCRKPPIKEVRELAERTHIEPILRYFAIAPLMHGAALWSTLISLYAGHTVVLDSDRHFDAAHIWDVVERDDVNIISVVGDAMAQPLVAALEKEPGRWDLSKLIVIGNGGAPLSAGVKERLVAALPRLIISNGIGSSETGIAGSGSQPSIGGGLIALKQSADLVLFDDQRRPITEPGQEGVLARTGWTAIGYYGDPKKTAETFVTVNGKLWVISGDRARLDKDENIVVLGRGSQCINSGGEKIYTEEVEEAVRRHPAVADVLVVGVPDPRLGQRVAAVVQPTEQSSVTLDDLQVLCRKYLSSYKIPRAVYLVNTIQRSPAGKPNYTWAREYAQKHEALR